MADSFLSQMNKKRQTTTVRAAIASAESFVQVKIS
jgi:hypothetical protein